jgi:hypothetical protein
LQDTAWHSYLAQQALIALQATCLVAGLWVVVMAITADPGAALYACAVHRRAGWGGQRAVAGRPAQRLVSKTAFNLAQLLLILVIVRVLTWPLTGNWPTAATLRGWILEPWSFLDGFFIPNQRSSVRWPGIARRW